MKGIEAYNETLKDVLPKTYVRFENATLRELLRIFSRVPMDIEGDVFGRIYEYFLGKFAMADGQRGGEMSADHFPDGVYRDVPGLCKVATVGEIESQGWSLNPGRYVGVAEREEEDFDFAERLTGLHEELEVLNAEAHELEARIAENVSQLLGNL